MKLRFPGPKSRTVIELFGPMEVVALAVFLATLLVWAATISAVLPRTYPGSPAGGPSAAAPAHQ